METKNCIVCGKQVYCWAGHIHTEIGIIATGWCEEHQNERRTGRPRSDECTSSNPHSCQGDYKLSEIELNEEINEKTIVDQMEYMKYSNMIDSYCSPYHPKNKRKKIFGLF